MWTRPSSLGTVFCHATPPSSSPFFSHPAFTCGRPFALSPLAFSCRPTSSSPSSSSSSSSFASSSASADQAKEAAKLIHDPTAYASALSQFRPSELLALLRILRESQLRHVVSYSFEQPSPLPVTEQEQELETTASTSTTAPPEKEKADSKDGVTKGPATTGKFRRSLRSFKFTSDLSEDSELTKELPYVLEESPPLDLTPLTLTYPDHSSSSSSSSSHHIPRESIKIFLAKAAKEVKQMPAEELLEFVTLLSQELRGSVSSVMAKEYEKEQLLQLRASLPPEWYATPKRRLVVDHLVSTVYKQSYPEVLRSLRQHQSRVDNFEQSASKRLAARQVDPADEIRQQVWEELLKHEQNLYMKANSVVQADYISEDIRHDDSVPLIAYETQLRTAQNALILEHQQSQVAKAQEAALSRVIDGQLPLIPRKERLDGLHAFASWGIDLEPVFQAQSQLRQTTQTTLPDTFLREGLPDPEAFDQLHRAQPAPDRYALAASRAFSLDQDEELDDEEAARDEEGAALDTADDPDAVENFEFDYDLSKLDFGLDDPSEKKPSSSDDAQSDLAAITAVDGEEGAVPTAAPDRPSPVRTQPIPWLQPAGLWGNPDSFEDEREFYQSQKEALKEELDEEADENSQNYSEDEFLEKIFHEAELESEATPPTRSFSLKRGKRQSSVKKNGLFGDDVDEEDIDDEDEADLDLAAALSSGSKTDRSKEGFGRRKRNAFRAYDLDDDEDDLYNHNHNQNHLHHNDDDDEDDLQQRLTFANSDEEIDDLPVGRNTGSTIPFESISDLVPENLELHDILEANELMAPDYFNEAGLFLHLREKQTSSVLASPRSHDAAITTLRNAYDVFLANLDRRVVDLASSLDAQQSLALLHALSDFSFPEPQGVMALLRQLFGQMTSLSASETAQLLELFCRFPFLRNEHADQLLGAGAWKESLLLLTRAVSYYASELSGPQIVSALASSAAVSFRPNDKRIARLCQQLASTSASSSESAHKVKQLSLQQVTTLFEALATLNFTPPSAWLDELQAHIDTVASQATFVDTCRILGAFATWKHSLPKPTIVRLLRKVSGPAPDTISRQDYDQLAIAFQFYNIRVPSHLTVPILESVERTQSDLMQSCFPQKVLQNIIWQQKLATSQNRQ